MRLYINKGIDEVVKEEHELLFSKDVTPWKRGDDLPPVGDLVSWMGCVYRVTSDNPPEDPEHGYPAPRSSNNFAMHPTSAIRLIYQSVMIETMVTVIDHNQCWIYIGGDLPLEHSYHLAYGEKHYSRSNLHGLSETLLAQTFCGLLTHKDLGLLDDYVSTTPPSQPK
ncbi:TPA: hypothetical protein ACPVZG_000604 [Vibrio parahaemolyticus]